MDMEVKRLSAVEIIEGAANETASMSDLQTSYGSLSLSEQAYVLQELDTSNQQAAEDGNPDCCEIVDALRAISDPTPKGAEGMTMLEGEADTGATESAQYVRFPEDLPPTLE